MASSSGNLNSSAVAALAVSVIAFFIFPPLGILGIYLGRRAKKEIDRRDEGGEGIADAGIIIGWIDVVLTILAIVIGIILLILFLVIGIGAAAGAAGAA